MYQLERNRGSIVRIKLQSFMTFSSCEFFPGPRMNLILGPNGSGKSALVCAMCLGLGGSHKLLGRVTELSSFVKRGQPSAKIEIELYDPKSKTNLVVVRLLSASNNSSEWMINDRAVSLAAVQIKLKDMDIQVDNLCQFLPQDRVEEFSKFNEKELLRETIRVVLGEKHLELQAKHTSTQKELDQEIDVLTSKQNRLEELEQENNRNQGLVQRQRDRTQMLTDIHWMEIKLPYLKFDETRAKALEAKEMVVKKEKEAKEESKTLVPLKRALEETSQELTRIKSRTEKLAQDEKSAVKNLETRFADVTLCEQNVADVKEEETTVKMKEANARQRLATKLKKIHELEQKMGDRKGAAYYDGEISQLKREYQPLTNESARMKTELAIVNAEQSKLVNELEKDVKRKLKALDDSQRPEAKQDLMEIDKIESIRVALKESEERKKILLDYRKQRHLFLEKFVGPMICELRAKTVDANRALELFMPASTQRYMVMTNEDDARRVRKDGISCILVVGNEFPAPHRPDTYSAELFKEMGIVGYLDELVVGDALAVEAGRRLAKIHNCLVGTSKTESIYEKSPELFKKLVPRVSFMDRIVIFTPTSRIDISRSRYGERRETIRKVGIDPTRKPFLKLALNVAEENEGAQKLADERNGLKTRKSALEFELSELEKTKLTLSEALEDTRKQEKQLKQDITKLTSLKEDELKLETKLDSERETAKDLEREANQDWNKVLERTQRKLEKEKNKLEQSLDALIKALPPSKLYDQWTQANVEKVQLDAEKQLLTELLREEEHRLSSMSETLEQLKKKAAALLKETLRLKKVANDKFDLTKCYLDTCNQDKCTHTWDMLSTSYPAGVEELEASLASKQHTVSRMYADDGVLRKFEANAKMIEELKTEISTMDDKSANKRAQLKIDMEDWIAPVKGAVETIHLRFSQNFEKLSQKGGYFCRAQVALSHDKKSLADYGAEISVSFRSDQEMKRLNNQVQSGGERSLTTFMYMLALQDLSKVPFRVVDEINQGIDSDKERLAFNILAEATSENPAQYFLATPKLLPGLQFPKDATVLFVFNGLHALTQSDWHKTNFFKQNENQRKRLSIHNLEGNEEEEEKESLVQARSKRLKQH